MTKFDFFPVKLSHVEDLGCSELPSCNFFPREIPAGDYSGLTFGVPFYTSVSGVAPTATDVHVESFDVERLVEPRFGAEMTPGGNMKSVPLVLGACCFLVVLFN